MRQLRVTEKLRFFHFFFPDAHVRFFPEASPPSDHVGACKSLPDLQRRQSPRPRMKAKFLEGPGVGGREKK